MSQSIVRAGVHVETMLLTCLVFFTVFCLCPNQLVVEATLQSLKPKATGTITPPPTVFVKLLLPESYQETPCRVGDVMCEWASLPHDA